MGFGSSSRRRAPRTRVVSAVLRALCVRRVLQAACLCATRVQWARVRSARKRIRLSSVRVCGEACGLACVHLKKRPWSSLQSGVAQGCPLSPILFLFITEGLSRMVLADRERASPLVRPWVCTRHRRRADWDMHTRTKRQRRRWWTRSTAPSAAATDNRRGWPWNRRSHPRAGGSAATMWPAGPTNAVKKTPDLSMARRF